MLMKTWHIWPGEFQQLERKGRGIKGQIIKKVKGQLATSANSKATMAATAQTFRLSSNGMYKNHT